MIPAFGYSIIGHPGQSGPGGWLQNFAPAFTENVLRNYFRERSKRRMHARDLERINAAADRLNSEAAEVLNYQAPED